MDDHRLIKLAEQFELGSSCGNIANYVLLKTGQLEFLCDEHFTEFCREVSYPTKREKIDTDYEEIDEELEKEKMELWFAYQKGL